MPYEPKPFGVGSDLGAYLRQELHAIADEMNNAQGAASIYSIAASTSIAAVNAYTPINLFTLATPSRDYRAVQPALPDALYVRRPGQIAVSFTLTALTPGNGSYQVSLFVNDVLTNLTSSVDPSNQTVEGTFGAVGTFRVNGSVDRVADKFDLRVRYGAGTANWTLQRGYFSVWWLGD